MTSLDPDCEVSRRDGKNPKNLEKAETRMSGRKEKHTEKRFTSAREGSLRCAASGRGGAERWVKEEARTDQWGSGEEGRQQMSVGRGARGGARRGPGRAEQR